MRKFLGCLYLLFVLPFLVLAAFVGWGLSRWIDPNVFRKLTNDREFDYCGRWSTGDRLGIFGMFGAVAPESVEDEIELTIYYSHFQGFKRGKVEKRKFRPAKSWTEIPVATRHGDEAHFPYLEAGQLIWISWDKANESPRDGWFGTVRPMSHGSWCLTINRTQNSRATRGRSAMT